MGITSCAAAASTKGGGAELNSLRMMACEDGDGRPAHTPPQCPDASAVGESIHECVDFCLAELVHHVRNNCDENVMACVAASLPPHFEWRDAVMIATHRTDTPLLHHRRLQWLGAVAMYQRTSPTEHTWVVAPASLQVLMMPYRGSAPDKRRMQSHEDYEDERRAVACLRGFPSIHVVSIYQHFPRTLAATSMEEHWSRLEALLPDPALAHGLMQRAHGTSTRINSGVHELLTRCCWVAVRYPRGFPRNWPPMDAHGCQLCCLLPSCLVLQQVSGGVGQGVLPPYQRGQAMEAMRRCEELVGTWARHKGHDVVVWEEPASDMPPAAFVSAASMKRSTMMCS